MTMAPLGSPARPAFRTLRELRERLAASASGHGRLANLELSHLSMGMSGDFEEAIEEGATLLRLGTALFGPRPGVPD
jgi:hypothetical protein